MNIGEKRFTLSVASSVLTRRLGWSALETVDPPPLSLSLWFKGMAESPESQLQGLDLQGKNVLLDEKGKFILYYSAVKTLRVFHAINRKNLIENQ